MSSETKRLQYIKNLKLCMESFDFKIIELNQKQSEYFKIIRTKIEEFKKKILELKEAFLNRINNFGEFETLNDQRLDDALSVMNNLKIPSIDIDIKEKAQENDEENIYEKYVFILENQKLLQIDAIYDQIFIHDLNIRNMYLNRLDSSILSVRNGLFIHTGSCYLSYLYKINPLSLTIISSVHTIRSGFSMIYDKKKIISFQLNSEKCRVVLYNRRLEQLSDETLEINQAKSALKIKSEIFVVNSMTVWVLSLNASENYLDLNKKIIVGFEIVMIIGYDRLFLISNNKNAQDKLFDYYYANDIELDYEFPSVVMKGPCCYYLTGNLLKKFEISSGDIKSFTIN